MVLMTNVYGTTRCVENGHYYDDTIYYDGDRNYIHGIVVWLVSTMPTDSGMYYNYRDVMNRHFAVFVPNNLLEKDSYVPLYRRNSNLGS